MSHRYILTLSCHDVLGIVGQVAGFLSSHDCFIVESAQFGDFSTGRFFMRTVFDAGPKAPSTSETLAAAFRAIAEPFRMDWDLYDTNYRQKVVLLVSKQSHCLNHILHRHQTGALPIDIPAILSNHSDLEELASWHKIPFIHLPVSPETKMMQEKKIWELVQKYETDLVVLARYMQILSSDLCRKWAGKAINIHHSFLPSFKGAKPYHQAFDRGVKLIGATAHYVTEDLDEGPIIEQEVARVDHTHTPESLVALGWDIENQVLARAIKYHIERRVLLNGHKTVVFK